MPENNDVPSINETLIEKYMTEGNLRSLISIFDFQRRQMQRAEAIAVAATNQMVILEKRLQEARAGQGPASPKPRPESPVTSHRGALGSGARDETRDETPAPKPTPPKKPKNADLAMDLDL